MGGNTWAGGTGGRDTAGLGGKGGPYRLDKGHDVHQVGDLFYQEEILSPPLKFHQIKNYKSELNFYYGIEDSFE